MGFTIPVSMTMTGLVKSITKTVNVSQEIITEIEYVIPSGSTDLRLALNIEDVSKVNLLSFTTTSPLSFKFDYTGDEGWTYYLTTSIVLFNDSLRIYDNDLSALPGQLMDMYITNNGPAATLKGVIVASAD